MRDSSNGNVRDQIGIFQQKLSLLGRSIPVQQNDGNDLKYIICRISNDTVHGIKKFLLVYLQ